MRNLSPTERGYIEDPAGHWCFVYAEITNADGSWINLSDVVVGSRTADFVTTFSFSDNQDENTHSITIALMREVGAYSLSPFRGDSPLNVDDTGTTFAPLADLHRQWRLFGVILPRGTFPSSPADYREWWTGFVDRLDVAGDPATITLQGRGKEADLIDARIIDVPKTYAGDDLGPWIQAVLDGQMGVGVVPLTVDGSAPAFFVNDRDLDAQGDMGLMDLITETAALSGALTRYKYDASDVLTFTLFAPNRTPTTPDWSTTANEYEKLDVGIGLDAVRNYVVVRYVDATFGVVTVTSPATPVSASITRYGLRVIVIDLSTSTAITDQTAAGNFADAIRSDLEFPIIEQRFTGHGLWFAELGDYVQLVANGVHYDQDQFGGITSVQHTFANGELTSSFGIRGNPSGRYRTWLDYGPGAPRVAVGPEILSGNGTFIEWVAPMPVGTFSIELIVAPNQYAKSAIWDLSETADFAVILDTHYSNFLDPFDPTAGAQGNLFSIADAGRLKTYYVRVTPYSGHLGGWPLGSPVPPPTGVAGPPYYIVVGTDTLRPTKPQFDVLEGTVTALAAEPLTTWDDPSGLTNFRKWVDSATAAINVATPNEIAVDVVGVAEIAGALGEIGIPIWFYKTPLASAQWLTMGTIPASEEEMGTEYRRQHYLVGAGRGRWHAIVKAVTGTPTVKLKSSTDAFSSSADVDSLSITGTGYLLSSGWTALPSTAQDDVRVSPFLLDGAGTASVDFYALWYEVLPDLVTAFRDFSDDFSDDFS